MFPSTVSEVLIPLSTKANLLTQLHNSSIPLPTNAMTNIFVSNTTFDTSSQASLVTETGTPTSVTETGTPTYPDVSNTTGIIGGVITGICFFIALALLLLYILLFLYLKRSRRLNNQRPDRPTDQTDLTDLTDQTDQTDRLPTD